MTSAQAPAYNKKSPTIKRILREAAELANGPSPDYHAAPLESNLFEWHFTLRGPPETPYADGIYHGRITLPPAYPMRPPSFRFLSPSGRFEVNREICLSISNYHEEEWQPAWGVRTAVVALRGFMENDPKGQVGGMECSQGQRRMIALESRAWKCETCGKSSAEILKESEEAARELGEEGRVEVVMPPELRIGYKKVEAGEGSPGSAEEGEEAPLAPTPTVPLVPVENSSPPPPQVQEVNRVPVHLQGPLPPYLDPRYAPTPQQAHEEDTFWVDRLIFGLVVALVAVVAKKLLA